MQSADLTVSLPEWMQLPEPEYLDPDAVVREEMLSWRTDGDVVYFLSLVTGDLAACREAATDVEPLRRAEFTPVDGETFYVYVAMERREADETLMDAVDVPGLVLVPPVVYTDAGTVQLTVLGEESTLTGLLESFPEDVDVTVDRVGDHGRLGGSLAGRLTRRQFEALRTARDLGYYEVPREVPLAAVADALDCSESAASTLLRKAERALVDAALVGEGGSQSRSSVRSGK